jgi:hypothetical protein
MNLRLPKLLDSFSSGTGVMEYWSVEKTRRKSDSHYSNTPVLQYSAIRGIKRFLNGLPSFGL